MKSEDLIRVYSGSEVSVLYLKKELEENHGIATLTKNAFRAGVAAGFVAGLPSITDLYIQEADLKRAEPVILEFVKNNKE